MDTNQMNELLRKRYGQDRFDPSAGQTQMTFQEWLDRHPALQGRGGAKNWGSYSTHTGIDGGGEYSGPASPAPTNLDPRQMKPPIGQAPASLDLTSPEVVGQMGAPDAPARQPIGGSYDQYVKTHGGKSTAGLAATWRGANNMKLNRKMAQTAAGRRISKNKGSE